MVEHDGRPKLLQHDLKLRFGRHREGLDPSRLELAGEALTTLRGGVGADDQLRSGLERQNAVDEDAAGAAREGVDDADDEAGRPAAPATVSHRQTARERELVRLLAAQLLACRSVRPGGSAWVPGALLRQAEVHQRGEVVGADVEGGLQRPARSFEVALAESHHAERRPRCDVPAIAREEAV